MRQKLTKEEQKFLEAWQAVEMFDELLRTDPRFCAQYERLIEDYLRRHRGERHVQPPTPGHLRTPVGR